MAPSIPRSRQSLGGSCFSGGMWVLNFVAALLAILTAVGAVSAEVSNGTMAALAARPVSRWKILIGKALGLVLMLAAFVAVFPRGRSPRLCTLSPATFRQVRSFPRC